MTFRFRIACWVAFLALVPGHFGAEPQVVNGVVAIVNDKIITLKDVFRAMAKDLDFLRRDYAGRPAEYERRAEQLQKEWVRDLVEKELVLHEYKTAGYSLPESYIENEINKDIRQYGDRLALTKTLQAEGVTFEQYRDQIRERVVLAEMWRHNVPQDPLISPHRIEVYYNENLDKYKLSDQAKLRMIVFAKSGDYPEYSGKKLAEEVLQKIKQGTAFGEMAGVYSQGSQKGAEGEWFERTVLRKDLAEVAFGLKAGEVSPVVEAPDGFYLLQVDEIRPAHIRPLSEVRDEIEGVLKDREKKRMREQFINKLEKKSFVRFF